MSAIKNNSWPTIETQVLDCDKDAFKNIKLIKDKLSINSDENVLLRGTRLVIPKALQKRIVYIAHEGHQGMVKTKQLIREKVWFSDIDSLVTHIINQCVLCQCTVPEFVRQPYIMSPLPNAPWCEVSIDFKHISQNEYLIVITDDYSRYPVVEPVRSTSSKHVIPVMDRVFTMFGVPEVVTSDNGPPFQGDEFRKFAEFMGFKHRKITPFHPRANAECERFMRTLGKVIKIASTDKQPCRFLRTYRATPHSTTGISPATALFGRSIRVRLSEIKQYVVIEDSAMRTRDREHKENMRQYADGKSYVKEYHISVGDEVLVRNMVKGVSQTYYEKMPYIVINVNGNMVTAQRNEHKITRNANHLKKVNGADDELDLDVKSDNGDNTPNNPVRSPIKTRSAS